MLLDNRDVLAWARGQLLQPAAPTTSPLESLPTRRQARKPARTVDEAVRAPKLGSQLRFDLSAEGLRNRRSSGTEPLR